MAMLAHAERGLISVYARGSDYHDVMKSRLRRVARWLSESHGADVKLFVDTAPLMEKPLATAAGLGWQGKRCAAGKFALASPTTKPGNCWSPPCATVWRSVFWAL